MKVDSLVDIASNKLLALFGRATLRDFVDVYFLTHEAGFHRFDLYWLGVAFERLKTFREDSTEMLLLSKPLPFQDLSRFFGKWRDEIASQL